MKRIRVTRTLVYEGEESWIKATMDRRATKMSMPWTTSKGTIRETAFHEEVLLSPAEEAWEKVSIEERKMLLHSRRKYAFIAGYEAAERRNPNER